MTVPVPTREELLDRLSSRENPDALERLAEDLRHLPGEDPDMDYATGELIALLDEAAAAARARQAGDAA